MRTIIALLIARSLAACGAAGQGAPPPPAATPLPAATTPAGGTAGVLGIERVDVVVAESAPPQVSVRFTGYLADGCTSLGAISQRRFGSAIEVTVATSRAAADACTMVATPVEQTLRLEGAFPAGSYTVTVNGVAKTFTV